jgi:capsular polysaccharide transport system permease protein
MMYSDTPPSSGSRPAAAPLPPAGTARRFGISRTISALVLREMSTTYGRSPGGYLWAILEPVGVVLMLSLAFALLLRAPSLGTSFILFYATGYLPLRMYTTLADRVAKAIRFSRPLLTYPKVTFMHAILARFLLQGLTQVMVVYIVFSGILVFADTRAMLDFSAIGLAMAMAATLALGVGAMNCYLLDTIPIWERLWGILMRPLMIASSVFYLLEDLPRKAQQVLWYNPIVHIVGVMRTGFYPTYHPTYVSLPFVFGSGVVLAALGFLLLRRYHLDLLAK